MAPAARYDASTSTICCEPDVLPLNWIVPLHGRGPYQVPLCDLRIPDTPAVPLTLY